MAAVGKKQNKKSKNESNKKTKQKRKSSDWPGAFGAFKCHWPRPLWGSCSLIGRIVCVAVAVARDAGSKQSSSSSREAGVTCGATQWLVSGGGLATLARNSGSWHRNHPQTTCASLHGPAPSSHPSIHPFIHPFTHRQPCSSGRSLLDQGREK